MAKKTLRLIADSYDQRQGDKPDSPLKAIAKGELFEPRSQEEYDRLVDSGAAEDPAELQKRAEEELESRREQLEAEKAQIDEQLKGAKAPEKLSGKQLDEQLGSRGLSTDGTVDDKRARLAAAVADESSG